MIGPQTSLAFPREMPDSNPRVTPVSGGLIVEWTAQHPTISEGAEGRSVIEIPGFFTTDQPGAPRVPFSAVLVALPPGANPSIEVLAVSESTKRINPPVALGEQPGGVQRDSEGQVIGGSFVPAMLEVEGAINPVQLEQIGVLGHSTGGGASIEFCFENPICGALLGMDPWLEPVSIEKLESGHLEPMLLMFSDSWTSIPSDEGNKPFVEKLVSNSVGWLSEMVISDTMHFDFSITPVISPLTEFLGFKGSLDGDRILEIINVYSVEFFDRFLRSTIDCTS